ncbi:cyclodeaminase/cyclohydrolase family protein [Streptomyces coffeae]|uniref:Cyclodeaminase/cyclohydrolase family protein n=1 Tax=Streptomyces coffeae TaxID=621382 RepID=A0ABS1NE82_9ACTN|nr:cyclodeaminase/cyclohydrolase family protein [Streptomyces coffeae]MBL1098367.1 cyclodeaminase/cyclohydrolase family protein [Streptomyces coffeae]
MTAHDAKTGDFARQPIGQFLDALAARVPAPGGGATAALHAAQAAALLSMVARYTTGKKYSDDADLVAGIIDVAEAERAAALRLASEDATAFTAVTGAYGMPRATPQDKERRSTAIAAALAAAAGPPAEVIRVARSLVSLAEALLPVANPNVITDVAAAGEAARAAATTARLNVEINLGGIRDEKVRSDLLGVLEQVDPLTERAAAVERSVRAALT